MRAILKAHLVDLNCPPAAWMKAVLRHVSVYQKRLKTTLLKDLRTPLEYLDYCKNNGLDVRSSLARGTMYELSTMQFLEHSFHCNNLKYVGGAHDNGVDLFGLWDLSAYFNLLEHLPTKLPANCLISKSLQYKKDKADAKSIDLRHDVQALVQCKNYRTRVKASTIRELAGIYEFHVKTALDRLKYFVFLVSPVQLTRQAVTQMDTSDVPMLHITLSPNIMGPHTTREDHYDPKHWSQSEPGAIYINPRACKLLVGLTDEIIRC